MKELHVRKPDRVRIREIFVPELAAEVRQRSACLALEEQLRRVHRAGAEKHPLRFDGHASCAAKPVFVGDRVPVLRMMGIQWLDLDDLG